MVGFLIRLIVIRSSAWSFIAPNQNFAVVYALLSEVGGAIVSVSGSREQNCTPDATEIEWVEIEGVFAAETVDDEGMVDDGTSVGTVA